MVKTFLRLQVTATTSGTTNAAEVIAAQINENTGVHGAVADAFNRVVGADLWVPDFSMTADIYYYY